MTRDWSGRSALQYAYSTVMNIDPDDIKKIEEERDAMIKQETAGIGIGILGYIEKRAEIEDKLPKFPDIPEDLKMKFLFAECDFERMHRSHVPLYLGPAAYEAMKKHK